MNYRYNNILINDCRRRTPGQRLWRCSVGPRSPRTVRQGAEAVERDGGLIVPAELEPVLHQSMDDPTISPETLLSLYITTCNINTISFSHCAVDLPIFYYQPRNLIITAYLKYNSTTNIIQLLYPIVGHIFKSGGQGYHCSCHYSTENLKIPGLQLAKKFAGKP
jgi:hypothetical protein